MKRTHLCVLPLGFLLLLLVGCQQGADPEPPALTLESFEIPGQVYGVVWPEVPPFHVASVSGTRLALTFNKPLAEAQSIRPFYLQWGHYVGIYPSGSDDPFYGGPASDVFTVEGNRFTIQADHGGLPMGAIMLVIPEGLAVADGTVLQEPIRILLSQGAISPHKRLETLVADESGSRVLAIPSKPGGPPVGYVHIAETHLMQTPGQVPIRTLTWGDSFVFTGEEQDGWRQVTLYERAPDVLQRAIPWQTDVYGDSSLTIPVTGWVRATEVTVLPPPAGEGAMAVVTRSRLHSEDGRERAVLHIHLPPGVWWQWPLPEGMPLLTAQIAAAQFRAFPLLDDYPGVLHRLSTLHVNGEERSVTDLRAHPTLLGLSEAEWAGFSESRKLYLELVKAEFLRVGLPEPFKAYQPVLLEWFQARAQLEEELLQWLRLDQANSLASLFGRIKATGLAMPPEDQLESWFQEILADERQQIRWQERTDDAFIAGWHRLLDYYGGYSLQQFQIGADLMWKTGSLEFRNTVRVVMQVADDLYLALSDHHGYLWLQTGADLAPEQSYEVQGTLRLDPAAHALGRQHRPDWLQVRPPVITVDDPKP